MAGQPITSVREHCARFGEKFFEENGKLITLIKFGSEARKFTFRKEQDFQNNLQHLSGNSGGTNFSKPLRLLKDTIVND
jgi:hypothetical protein